jgi:hypothetical protein
MKHPTNRPLGVHFGGWGLKEPGTRADGPEGALATRLEREYGTWRRKINAWWKS